MITEYMYLHIVHEIHQLSTKLSVASCKIYQNLDFWFKNKTIWQPWLAVATLIMSTHFMVFGSDQFETLPNHDFIPSKSQQAHSGEK
jgi:hypothetical protein